MRTHGIASRQRENGTQHGVGFPYDGSAEGIVFTHERADLACREQIVQMVCRRTTDL